MGKVYQFPQHKRINSYKPPVYKENQTQLKALMDLLVENYQSKIEELEEYKRQIEVLDKTNCKGTKELLRLVKKLQKQFLQYGLSCNFYRFYTVESLEVIFFNETQMIYVFKKGKKDNAEVFSISEFIVAYQNYPFSLSLDEGVYKIFNTQIENLKTTIEVLESTQV